MSDFNIDIFLAGVPKSATTWIYRCCKEHPDINVPSEDSLRYFDLKYHKGSEWYQSYFNSNQGKVTIDPSPTYFRSPVAASRIANDYPNARFIVSLRNPVIRAFSQFWHEKKEGNFDYKFEECLHRFVLYSWYIETGFYATQFETWMQHFNRDRFHVVLYDDLERDSAAFIKDIFEFIGVDSSFKPSILDKRVNQAGKQVNTLTKTLRKLKQNRVVEKVSEPVLSALFGKKNERKRLVVGSSKSDYKSGITEEMRTELLNIYLPQIEKLEQHLDLDLTSWKQ
jgi:hypothetical protein